MIADALNNKTALDATVDANVVTVSADYAVTFNIDDSNGDGATVAVAEVTE